MISSKIIGAWRFFLFLMVYSTVYLPFYIASKISTKAAYFFGRLFLRSSCYVLGHRVIIRGQPNTQSQTLFCINHISYLDIAVVGPHVPGRFIAKSEVKNWPIFGQMSTMYGSVYIERTSAGISEGLKQLDETLKRNENLILFPEGTTSDGCRVLPFASSFFDVAMKNNLTVQPVTLAYAGWDGMPMPRYLRKLVGWFSPDLEMMPHLWQMAQLGKIQAIITFHPPIQASDFPSRKALAKKAWESVNQGLFDSFSTPIYKEAA